MYPLDREMDIGPLSPALGGEGKGEGAANRSNEL